MKNYEDYKVDDIDKNGNVIRTTTDSLSREEVYHKLKNGANGNENYFEVEIDEDNFILKSVCPELAKVVYTLIPGSFEKRNEMMK